MVEVNEGDAAATSGTQQMGADAAGVTGGGGGGAITAAGVTTEVTVEASNRIGLGDRSSRTPAALPASLWSGDIAPSLLDSSSYCTYKLGCFRGSPSLVLLNISCPSLTAFSRSSVV